MRIVAGTLKGRRLQGPPAGDLAVRPTSDRAREALFSILEPRPRGTFVDLFAGTGAVALEAWSRGHAPVIGVESSAPALRLLRDNVAGTGVAILPVDVRRLKPDAFRDVLCLFADPPYAGSGRLLEELAPRLRGWLAEEGMVIWEQSARDPFAAPAGFRLLDRRCYGAAAFHFLGPST